MVYLFIFHGLIFFVSTTLLIECSSKRQPDRPNLKQEMPESDRRKLFTPAERAYEQIAREISEGSNRQHKAQAKDSDSATSKTKKSSRSTRNTIKSQSSASDTEPLLGNQDPHHRSLLHDLVQKYQTGADQSGRPQKASETEKEISSKVENKKDESTNKSRKDSGRVKESHRCDKTKTKAAESTRITGQHTQKLSTATDHSARQQQQKTTENKEMSSIKQNEKDDLTNKSVKGSKRTIKEPDMVHQKFKVETNADQTKVIGQHEVADLERCDNNNASSKKDKTSSIRSKKALE